MQQMRRKGAFLSLHRTVISCFKHLQPCSGGVDADIDDDPGSLDDVSDSQYDVSKHLTNLIAGRHFLAR